MKVPLTLIEQLECEFNRGKKFDIKIYQENIDSLSTMGFSHDQCIEALIITENRGIDQACNYLFMTKADQSDKRQKVFIGKN